MSRIKQLSDIRDFKLSFPPTITVQDIIMSIKKNGRKVKRPPNAFMIYRKAFCNEAAKSYRFYQMEVSSLCGNSWRREPKEVKEYYYKLATEVDMIFNYQHAQHHHNQSHHHHRQHLYHHHYHRYDFEGSGLLDVYYGYVHLCYYDFNDQLSPFYGQIDQNFN